MILPSIKKTLVLVFLSSVAVASYAQEIDYTKYLVLDSIKYDKFQRWDSSIHTYIEKYEYNEDGSQSGVKLYSKNEKRPVYGLESSYSWNIDANNLIQSYQTIDDEYLCSYHPNGMLASLMVSDLRGISMQYMTKTFDSRGVLTSKETLELDGNLHNESFEYGTRGLPLHFKNRFVFYNGQSGHSEVSYTEEGLPWTTEETITRNLSDMGFNVIETSSYRDIISFDEQSNPIKRTSEVFRTLDHEDEDYISSLGGGNSEIGREIYELEYNQWVPNGEWNLETDVERDSNGRIIKRIVYEILPWGDRQSDAAFTLSYEYDGHGNIIQQSYNVNNFAFGGYQRQCTYDQIGRIINESLSIGSGFGYDFKYAYDEVGNQINKDDFVRNCPYCFFYPVDVEYDQNGNIISETSENGWKYTYAYDNQGRLVAKNIFTLNNRTGEYDPYEKFTYDPDVLVIKSGAQMPFGDYNIFMDCNQVYAWQSHSVYKFDEPYMMSSYTKYDYGEEINVELFYSPLKDVNDAVNTVNQDTRNEEQYYDLQGRSLVTPCKGINIVRMSDGSSRKVIIK